MNLIAAVDKNWGIGKDNKLLFSLPDDMKFFVEKTKNKVVVMGKNTLLSFPGKKPLKNRTNIVLSTDKNFNPQGVCVLRCFEELFFELKKYEKDQVFLIGGQSVYNSLLPYCHKAYITHVDAVSNADKFLTDISKLPNWTLQETSKTYTNNNINFTFNLYLNNKTAQM